jgi:hypothetical protein
LVERRKGKISTILPWNKIRKKMASGLEKKGNERQMETINSFLMETFKVNSNQV